MSNNTEIRVVLGSLRYKSAPNVDFSLKVPLVQNTKLNVEFDRTSDISLQQLYDDERQASTIFRPSVKYQVLFKNSYAGETNYPPFENNLYYINANQSAAAQCDNPNNPSLVSWTGLPLYNEFDFIRNDYNVSGYTQPPNQHLIFVPESANTYNWNFYFSYPFENDYNKPLEVRDNVSNQVFNWNSGEGIPFVLILRQNSGQNLISFRTPIKHGLIAGEYVKIKFNTPPINYNGQDTFQVDSLGDNFYGSEEYVFNIVDVGYTGGTFLTNRVGTFKRIILDSNSADTISQYYIRRNKILTNPEDAVVVKAGFEENIFGIKKKLEKSAATPNYVTRVSIREGCQSYTFSCNKDIDLNGITDNLGRPVSELFATTIWKGYFGWTLGPNLKLKQGYTFNLPLQATNVPSDWWSDTTSNSNSNFNIGQYTLTPTAPPPPALPYPPYTFYYVESLKPGDTFDGDFCEWNNFEQKERVISRIVHKIKFNSLVFDIKSQFPTNALGYYYYPLHSIQLRDYSDYIETGDPATVDNLPNYAYYSSTLNQFLWRDLYTYGFLDTVAGLGTNFPFLNGAHYPKSYSIFRIIPEGTNYTEQTIIAQPLTDECE